MINIAHPITQSIELHGYHLDIRRLDQIHPEVNGNKWYKLKYNIEKALQTEHKTLLTFGGPWSNHIYSTSSAGKLMGIRTIGIIRGERPPQLSNTLIHAHGCGMQLEYIERLAYAEKDTEDFKGWLHEEYGSFILVPEGGSNFLGVNGCMEILDSLDLDTYDIICVAAGTGATAAGLLLSCRENQTIWAFPALKDGGFLEEEIMHHVRYFLMDEDGAEDYRDRLKVITDYHFGGYGKWNDELITFIKKMEAQYDLPLDQVYTGKLMFGLNDLLQKESLDKGKKILVIHTGGLQGRASVPEL